MGNLTFVYHGSVPFDYHIRFCFFCEFPRWTLLMEFLLPRGAGMAQWWERSPPTIPEPGVICGLSLLLVLFSAPRGFSPGPPVFPSPQKPTFPNSNSIWNCQALYHEPLARVIAQALPVFDIKFDLHLIYIENKGTCIMSPPGGPPQYQPLVFSCARQDYGSQYSPCATLEHI